MKLYFHPMSTTSRIVMLFIADSGIKVEEKVIDIFTGEHQKEPFTSINPNKLIPVLDDDGFILTESSAILKYLAEKTHSPAYPTELKARAKVNEAMDWFNSNFYRDWGYGLVYPQVFPSLKRSDEVAQKATVNWGKARSQEWLTVLDKYLIGPKNSYLCGNDITIADYFGTGIITAGEIVGCGYSGYPNVKRWLDHMKKRPSYEQVFGPFNGFVASLKGQAFETV